MQLHGGFCVCYGDCMMTLQMDLGTVCKRYSTRALALAGALRQLEQVELGKAVTVRLADSTSVTGTVWATGPGYLGQLNPWTPATRLSPSMWVQLDDGCTIHAAVQYAQAGRESTFNASAAVRAVKDGQELLYVEL